MTLNEEVFRSLSAEQSLARLAGVQPGRIVVRRSEEIDIFPVNFVIDEGSIYFRTAEGSKLFTISLNQDVLFEGDGVVDGTAWSVIIRGNARVLSDSKEISYADSLNLKPWAPTLKYNWVCVSADDISGREFDIAEEPERY
ncbi:pyridoxamine 5'-phosphate oxidase family protein [Corynebacterium alimapuense]|uniref:Pyridoxamine 5-phosphate oxidase n=1 Tax=Corynebacterium alimapuense TaxID=1576874 RepID=A0A3M8K916_9CORY|nr:pyridoxamine 5'-phosphate oxidase family protein [Corynebacterium alimapuense]RNE49711.1 pyridoxamine 5-phosphate oxidase [Corynebacterium alimapuense]